MLLRMLCLVLLLPALAGADDVPPPPQMVTFTPANSGTTAAPIVGLSHTETHFLLTSSGSTRYLPLDFTGNNQDFGPIPVPTTAKDAASYNAQWHFQLDTNNFVRLVSTTTGDSNPAFTTLPTSGAFGIGYDGVSDTLAVGTFDPASAILGLTLYPHVSLGQNLQPSLQLTIPFDPSQWGTPSGLDYHNHRFLVATSAGFHPNPSMSFNRIIDIDGLSGFIQQYWERLDPNGQVLNDILYDPATQSILLGYQSGSSGFIQHGPYPGLWLGRHGLAVGGMEGGEAVLSLHGLEWRAAYRIHASADLHAWQPIHSLTGPPIGGHAEFRVPIHPHPARFFKLEAP